MDNQHRLRIYMILCVANGKRYVGSASFYNQRVARHKKDLRSGTHGNAHLQNAWNKYGEGSFNFRELERVYLQKDLIRREQVWMERIHPEFNIAKVAGSPLGCKHSEESKAKRVASIRAFWEGKTRRVSEETKEKLRVACIGKHRVFSAEHKAHLSASATGRLLTEETKAKIRKAHLGIKREFSPAHKAAIKAAWDKRKGEGNGKST